MRHEEEAPDPISQALAPRKAKLYVDGEFVTDVSDVQFSMKQDPIADIKRALAMARGSYKIDRSERLEAIFEDADVVLLDENGTERVRMPRATYDAMVERARVEAAITKLAAALGYGPATVHKMMRDVKSITDLKEGHEKMVRAVADRATLLKPSAPGNRHERRAAAAVARKGAR